jgi:hypothetical protein
MILVSGAAAAQIAPAHVGYVVDDTNGLRGVFGVAGAFTVGPVIEAGVVSAAFSGSSLVLKRDGALIVDGRHFDAPVGSAVVTFDAAGRVSEVFFPDAGELWTWRGARFETCSAAGIVTDVSIRGDELIVEGLPVRLPQAVLKVSQMGERWRVAYCEKAWYAIRDGRVYELPEVDA